MSKPTKRSEHILQLSKEHHFSLLFCWKIRTGVKKEVDLHRIIHYIHYFWKDHLLPHFEEEDILFRSVDDELVKRAYNEHQQINESITNLHFSIQQETTCLVSNIADSVENHVRFEERELFLYLENKIEDRELTEIGKKIKHLKPEITQDVFDDEFWNE